MTRQEFIECVKLTHKGLRQFLVSVCNGDVETADDIAQETYIKAYLASNDFNDLPKFKSWVTKIAYNTFLNQTRQQKRAVVDIEKLKLQPSQDQPDISFQYESLYQALEDLPPGEKTSIVLYYLQGYNVKEISAIIDSSEEAVRKALSRGRKRLKSLIR